MTNRQISLSMSAPHAVFWYTDFRNSMKENIWVDDPIAGRNGLLVIPFFHPTLQSCETLHVLFFSPTLCKYKKIHTINTHIEQKAQLIFGVCLFIAVALRTVSEHTQCRCVMPLAQELVSSDPVPRRSGSPPRSSAGWLGTNEIGVNWRINWRRIKWQWQWSRLSWKREALASELVEISTEVK